MRQMVEDAGAIYVGVQYGSARGPFVLFQSAKEESTISLYVSAMSVDNVRLSVKNYEDRKRMVKVQGLG